MKYKVIRAWPGVTNGQIIELTATRADTLIKGKFVCKVTKKRTVKNVD